MAGTPQDSGWKGMVVQVVYCTTLGNTIHTVAYMAAFAKGHPNQPLTVAMTHSSGTERPPEHGLGSSRPDSPLQPGFWKLLLRSSHSPWHFRDTFLCEAEVPGLHAGAAGEASAPPCGSPAGGSAVNLWGLLIK